MADTDADRLTSSSVELAETSPRALTDRVRRFATQHRGITEIALLAALYGLYSMTRSFADGSLAKASDTAEAILRLEKTLGIDVELSMNRWMSDHLVGSIISSYWYASAHFVVTAGVLIWLFHRRPSLYPTMRNILLGATACALALFFLLPTAPPRLINGPYQDMLAATGDYGWWGEHASAPRGMGSMTNELAAFPSMHAGWSLWVAIAVLVATRNRTARVLAIAYPIITAVDVVFTGNHWTIDILAGWAIVSAIATLFLRAYTARGGKTTGDEAAPQRAMVEADASGQGSAGA